MTEKTSNSITIPLPSKISSRNILWVALVISSFIMGSLWTKLQYLEKAKTLSPNVALAVNDPNAAAPQAPQAAPPEDLSPKKVSVDDDPVLGNSNAQVTIVEFSDYECPFCKRHFDQTFEQLKKDYIDTGKVKLVYRDFPLSFHDPMATTEATAANCARAQGDDSTYFKYHDEIFKRTTSNGNGLTKDALYKISDDLGLDTVTLKTCMEDKTQADEVKKDIADGSAAGASGTPTFFIGKSTSDGVIEGTPLVGAQPYSAFQAQIDKLL